MKKKFIRLVLAKEDVDLIGWKNSLPPRTFTETVNKILVSESVGQIARIPYKFSSSEVTKEVRAGFYIDDENVLVLLNGIKKGGRTDVIKEIIRKHIKRNRKDPPKVVSMDLLCSVLADFRTKMEAREADYAGAEDKYRKLRNTYDFGMRMIFNAILACYKPEDEKAGDRQMRKLDVEKFVTQAFEKNFGPQRVSEEDV